MSVAENSHHQKLKDVLKTTRHNLCEDVVGKLEQLDGPESTRFKDKIEGMVGKCSDTQLIDELLVVKPKQIQEELDQLVDVRDAEKRMEQGTYGNCLACGESISSDRLNARPTVKLCSACET